ncbi:MAG TPA: DUF4234 domain-containing protein [Thermoleophilaceae bacterium]|jgi:hypothetical protein
MAPPEVAIRGGDARVKLRNPVTSAVLDAVTLGVYGFFWYFYVNRELAALGRARGTSELGDNPRNSLLALFPGILVLVPALISMLNTGERVEAAQRLAGRETSINTAAATIAMLVFFPIGIYYVQTELNKVWEVETETGVAASPPV